MAFKVVTIADRISQYPDRRRLTKEDGSSELVTVAAEEGTVSAEGTEWGAAYANDLETRIDAETHLLEGNFGTVETTTTASKAYAIGDCLVLNGQYYKVIAAISKGATLVVGTNIAVHSVSAINSSLTFPNGQGNFYADYQNGKHGYNTDPNRGAGTFSPFNNADVVINGAITYTNLFNVIGETINVSDFNYARITQTYTSNSSAAIVASIGMNAVVDISSISSISIAISSVTKDVYAKYSLHLYN